ncbi:hypothetical protein KCU95_g88, partial [Aureobasidium melanogenum]
MMLLSSRSASHSIRSWSSIEAIVLIQCEQLDHKALFADRIYIVEKDIRTVGSTRSRVFNLSQKVRFQSNRL